MRTEVLYYIKCEDCGNLFYTEKETENICGRCGSNKTVSINWHD